MPNDVADWTIVNQVVPIGGVSKAILGDVVAASLSPDQVTVTAQDGGSLLSYGNSVIASFKAAASSVIALKGVLGVFLAQAAATITPAFGQSPTAGSLLWAWVACDGNSPVTTASAGWSKVINQQGTVGDLALFIKPNAAGGDAAPTFTSNAATRMVAQLGEASGVATVTPTDQTTTGVPQGSGTAVLTNTAADVAFGDLVVWATRWNVNPAATMTFSEVINNGGTSTRAGDDGASSLSNHVEFAFSIIPPATIPQPLGVAVWAYDATGTSAPAAGSQAKVVLAATPGKTYICAVLSGGGAQTGATLFDNKVQLLDGATILFNRYVEVAASGASAQGFDLSGLGYKGTLGNSMTAQVDLASTTTQEFVNIGAYLR